MVAAIAAKYPAAESTGVIDSLLGGAEDYYLQVKFNDEMEACNARAGFRWPVVLPPASSYTPGRIDELTISNAQQYGYRAVGSVQRSEGGPESTRPGANEYDRYVASLTAAERERFNLASAACIGKTRAELYSTEYEQARQVFDEKRKQLIDRISGSPELARLDSAWSRCMKSAGYAFSREADARNAFTGAELTPAETSTAIADARCQDSLGYHVEYIRIIRSYETEFIAENEALMLEVYQAKYGKAYGS